MMKKILLLIAIILAAVQGLSAQDTAAQYKWVYEKQEVKQNGITYRYGIINTQLMNGIETEQSRSFVESWARKCQDSLLFTKGKVADVVTSVYADYIKALKVADSTGIYDNPVEDYKSFDVTKVRFIEPARGFHFGFGAAGIVPLGELNYFVSPIPAAYIEMGPSWEKFSLTACLTVGVGLSDGGYVQVDGVDGGKYVRYYALAATGMYSVYDTGKLRVSVSAGAGVGKATVSFYSMERQCKETARIGGPLISEGLVVDHQRRQTIDFDKFNHKKKVSFVRYRIYSDQLINFNDKVLTPTINISVAFLSNTKELAPAE